MDVSQKNKKSAKAKVMLTEIKPTLRLILELVSQISGRFSVRGGGLGGYQILFLYRIHPPIFPIGWPYFSTWPYFSNWVGGMGR